MINLENHRIVDMIPSRDTDDVCNWLETFRNIEVISSDGAITYASAATNSHPDVIQISSLWGLTPEYFQHMDDKDLRFIDDLLPWSPRVQKECPSRYKKS